MGDTPEDRFLVYFDRIVLCRYRSRPDLFRVKEDDIGGKVEVIDTDISNTTHSLGRFRVRFGFRELADGRVCVAAFGPDLEKAPQSERCAWFSDHIDSPKFAAMDQAFERWSQRYLHGSWESDDGPLRNLETELKLIQALTRFEFKEPLFKEAENPSLRYPVAENSESFTFAILELFRVAVDGLSLDVLEALASKLNIDLPPLRDGETRRSLNTLKTVLPPELQALVHEPLRACSRLRNKIHGVPSAPAYAFAAFKEFHSHAKAIHGSIMALREWLEHVLCLNAERCLKREEAMKYFPRFDGPLRPEVKEEMFQQAVGKTIAKIEAGEYIPGKGCHRREALVIHFDDGTILSIDVGSNAGNLESEFKGLDASKFSADLVPAWAPNPRA